MTRPPGQGSGDPWWARPGGAPQPGRPEYPPPPQPRPQYPPRQQPQQPYPPPQQPRPYYPPPQQQGWQPAPPAQPVAPQQPSAPPPAKPSQLPMIAGVVVGIIVVGTVALIGGLWLSGFLGSGTVLDVGAAEAGVTQVLSDPINGYGANDVSAIKCNGGKNPEVEAGQGFSCDVTINGAKRTVQVVFRDDVGTYEVDGPR